MAEKIERGIISSKRKVFDIGGSKAITLDKKWLDIQTWLGREVTELVSMGNEVIVLASPEKEQRAREILRKLEEVSSSKAKAKNHTQRIEGW